MPSLLNTLSGLPDYNVEEELKPSTKAENNFSFGEKFKRATLDESALSMSIKSGYEALTNDTPEDSEFISNKKLKEDIFKNYKNDILPEFKNYIFENSKNIYDFKDNLEYYKKQTKLENSINDMGISGILMRVGGAVPDVIPLIAGTVTAPVTTTAIGSSVALRTALGFGLATTAEGIRRTIGDKERTEFESAMSIGLGTAVAGLFGRASLSTVEAGKNSIKRTLQYDDKLEQDLAKAEAGSLLDEAGNKITVDDVIKARAKELNLSENQYKTFNTVFKEVQEQAKKKNFNEGFASQLRVDLAHLTKQSKSDSMAKFGEAMFPDSTLQTNKSNTQYMAETILEVEKRIQQSVANNFKELIDRYGSLAYGNNFMKTRFSGVANELSQIVGSAQVKRTLGKYTFKDAVEEVSVQLTNKGIAQEEADKLANDLISSAGQVAKDSHKTLVDYGKEGFVDGSIKANDNYMPIVYSFKTDEILKQKNFSDNDFANFLRDSIISNFKKNGKTISEEFYNQLDETSRLLATKMRKNEYSDISSNKSINQMMLDVLKENDKLPSSFKESLSAFARIRTPFDYTYRSTKYVDGKAFELGFDDLVNKDIFNIYNQYSKKMGGSVAGEKFKFDVTSSTYDFNLANTVKQTIVNEIKNQRQLGKLYELLDKNSVNLDSIIKVADKLYPTLGKSLDEVAGVLFNGETLSKMSNKERAEIIDKVLNDLDNTLIDAMNNSKQAIENILPKDLDKNSEIINLAKQSEELFRGFAKQAHKLLESAKATMPEQEYKDLFEKTYTDIVNNNTSLIDNLNKLQKDIFSKQETKTYNLATDEGIRIYREKISNELKDLGVTQREFNRELDRFDATIKEMKGLPTAINPNSIGMQSQRILRNLNIARLLGQTAFTMSAELASVVVQGGVRNFIEFAPSTFKGLMKQIKTGNIDNKLAQEIQTFMGLGGDLYKSIGIGQYEHDFNILALNNTRAFDNFLNKAELVSEKFAEATLLFGGVKPLTNLFQMVTATNTVNEIFNMVGKKTLSKNDAKFLNEIGIDVNMLARISNQISKHGSNTTKKWSNGHKVTELGFENWDDLEARKMLVTGVRRITDTVVQQSNIGDKIGTVFGRDLLRNSLLGKFALELKDYMISSYVKQFGRAYSRRDALMFATIMTQAGFLSISKVMQNQINYAGNEEKLKENMKPEKIAQSVISNMPMSSYLPMFGDVITDTLLGERYLSDGRYHSGVQSGVMSLPSLDFAMKFEQLAKAVPETIREGEVSNKTINSLFGLSPLGNTVLMKPIHQSLLKE